jgi:DNA-binding NarL/FixJ family response regulator
MQLANPVAELQHAIARAEGQVVTAVLLDLDLPDDRGASAVARFRGRFPHLPVIATAARGAEDEAKKALAAGARSYLLHDEIGRGLIAPLVRHCVHGAVQAGNPPTPSSRRLLHDLGNLLAAVSGSSEVLSGRVQETDPLAEDIRELHEAIDQSVRMFRKLAASWRSQAL